jgi:acetyl esterase
VADGKVPLRESGLFSTFYKYVVTTGEWFVKPILNLDPPHVGMHVRNIPYVKGRPHKKQRLDVVVPEGPGPFPLLIYVHGGGFITLDKSHYTRICKSFAAAGYVVFNVNYRRAPQFRFPDNITDVGSAVSWAISNAIAYRGDPDRVFMAGYSAGAHLVSTYATSLVDPSQVKALRIERLTRPRRIAGMVLFYGAFDTETILETGFPFVKMMLESFLSRDPVVFKERSKAASPMRHITASYPPCFISYAEMDQLSSQSIAFAGELEAKGVEHEVLAFSPSECKVMPHGYVSLFWRKSARKAMAAAIDFLKRHQ